MAYENYRLQNSNQIPIRPGSLNDTIINVGSELQRRYNQGIEEDSILRRMVKDSGALPQDEGMLNELVTKYEGRLDERAKKGDYENMIRDTHMDARDFMREYTPFVQNQQKVEEYRQSLNKAKIRPDKAAALLRMSMEGYKGLQKNNRGQLTGYFNGIQAVDDVDLPGKVDKYMKDIAPSVIGSKVHMVDGKWMKVSAGKKEAVTGEEIQRVLQAAVNIDPELQGWMNQEAQIATHGLDRVILDDIKDPVVEKQVADLVLKTGRPTGEVYRSLAMQQHKQNIFNSMLQYADKYRYSKTETESGITGANPYELKAAGDGSDGTTSGNFMAVQALGPGSGGLDIKSGDDINALETATGNKAQEFQKRYLDWKQQLLRTPGSDGKFYDLGNGRRGIRVNGKEVDVTADWNMMRQEMEDIKKDNQYLAEAKSRAASNSGFDKISKNPEYAKKYKEIYDRVYAEKSTDPSPRGISQGTDRAYTEEERLQRASKAANKVFENTPEYKNYVNELQKQLNNAPETSKVYMITNPKIRESWSNSFGDLAAGLGLEDTPIKVTVGSGKDSDMQIDEKGYDALKGKFTISGFTHDEKGNTVLVARAHQNISGKVKSGENMLFHIPNTNVDEYLRQNMAPEEYTQFKRIGELKAGMASNRAKTVELLANNNAVVKVNSFVDQDGVRKWRVSLPYDKGNKEVSTNSYEGILSLFDQYNAELVKKK